MFSLSSLGGAALMAASGLNFVTEYISGFETAALVCLIVGIVLMIIEMLTPGIGIAGITGACALIAAIVLRADSWENALITLAIIIVILVMAGIIIFTSFSKGVISRSAIMLNETIIGGSSSLNSDEAKAMVGKIGVSVNDLRPAGYAVFDGKRIDVVAAHGEYIPKDTYVEVIGVDGLKINVKETDKRPDTEKHEDKTHDNAEAHDNTEVTDTAEADTANDAKESVDQEKGNDDAAL